MITGIDAQALSFTYANGQGVSEATFHVEPGEIVSLFGKNGSGKTTLIKVLATLLSPSSGKVRIYDHDLVAAKELVRKQIFAVFDDNAHFGFVTARKNVEFFLQLHGVNVASAQIDDLAAKLSLNLAEKPENYSFGMKRKLLLLEGLLANKPVLLFDDPMLGIDSDATQLAFSFFKERKQNNLITIYSTSKITEVQAADRIFLIQEGRLVELSDPSSLIKHMIEVKMEFSSQTYTDHILAIGELPTLIEKYIKFGIPQTITITGGDNVVSWSPEAQEKVKKAPLFVQKMIYSLVENYAKANGFVYITPSVVDDARKRFGQ